MSRWSRKGLNQALMRAKLRLEQKTAGSSPVHNPAIIVKDRHREHVIPLESLDYVEAQGDYIALHSGGRCYLKLQPISELANTLDPSQFVRVHRSMIVNLERVARIAPYEREASVVLQDGTRIGMSRTGYSRLLEAMETALVEQEVVYQGAGN